MKALITGASSGIGKDMARYLDSLGYDLVIVARREERLKELSKELKNNVRIINLDLAKIENVYKLYELTKDESIDLLVNNAGFGLFGMTYKTDLNRELEMIDLNIKALHILTKLFLKDFVAKDRGRILNVASSAGFMAGPRLNTYYATKNYVLRFSTAIYEELKRMKSNVHISVLCPGPVETEFNKVAKGDFLMKGQRSDVVAKRGIDGCLKNKLVIVPSLGMKIALFFNKLVPMKLSLYVTYFIQERKSK